MPPLRRHLFYLSVEIQKLLVFCASLCLRAQKYRPGRHEGHDPMVGLVDNGRSDRLLHLVRNNIRFAVRSSQHCIRIFVVYKFLLTSIKF